MTEPLPDLVTKLKGDISDLLQALAEAKAALRDYQQESDRTSQKQRQNNSQSSQSEKEFARLVVGNIHSETNALGDLQRAFDETKKRRDALQSEFARTGGTSIFGDLQTAKSDMQKLSGYIQDMGGSTNAVSQDMAAAEASATGMLPIVAAIAAFFAPLLGGAASGGILAGLGAGGIGAGIVGQLHSTEVQGALASFKSEVGQSFKDATKEFAPATAQALDTVAQSTSHMLDGLAPAFDRLAPYLDKFAGGIARAEDVLLPYLIKGLDAAGPIIGSLADDLPTFAHAIGLFFEELGNGSKGAGEGLTILFDIIDAGIVIIGGALDGLSHLLDWSLQAVDSVVQAAIATERFVGIQDPVLQNLDKTIRNTRDSTQGLTMANFALNDSVQGQVGTVGQLTYAYDSLNAALTQYTNTAQKSDDTNLQMHQDLLKFHTELKKGAQYWDLNTKAGQANVQLLDEVNKGITDYYDSLRINGNLTPDQTKAELNELIAQRDLAKAYGASSDELNTMNTEIGILQASLLGLPKSRTVTINVRANITGDGSLVLGGMGHPLNGAGANSGIVGQLLPAYANSGIHAGRPGGMFRMAEQSTKREALIAEDGDRNRALASLATAASWFADDINTVNNHTVNNSYSVGSGGQMGYGVVNLYLDSRKLAVGLIAPVNRMNGRSSTSIYAGGRG